MREPNSAAMHGQAAGKVLLGCSHVQQTISPYALWLDSQKMRCYTASLELSQRGFHATFAILMLVFYKERSVKPHLPRSSKCRKALASRKLSMQLCSTPIKQATGRSNFPPKPESHLSVGCREKFLHQSQR